MYSRRDEVDILPFLIYCTNVQYHRRLTSIVGRITIGNHVLLPSLEQTKEVVLDVYKRFELY